MLAYVFVNERFSNSCLVSIIDENGSLLSKFEISSFTKAKEWAMKSETLQKYADRGLDLEFVQNPWSHEGIKRALIGYSDQYGVELNGRLN